MNDAASLTKLILLIDGENLDAVHARGVVRRANELGTVATARVYGQSTNPRVKAWRAVSAEHRLTMVDVTRISERKNSADFKLVVEAMDMLHTRQLDGFCIASSDGDFSALAERIRATALTLYVFGESKAPKAYRDHAHAFFDVALLAPAKSAPTVGPPQKPANVTAPRTAPAKPVPAPTTGRRGKASGPSPSPKSTPPSPAPKRQAAPTPAKPPPPTQKILAAIDETAGADGWAHSQRIGNAITTADRAFRVKTYAGNMATLLRTTEGVETKKDGTDTYARRRPPLTRR